MKKYLMLFLTGLLLISCATQTQFIDPAGRVMPDPCYKLQPIGYPILFTFYYTAVKDQKDVDGSIVHLTKYLSISEVNEIDMDKFDNITVTIEVMNPSQIQYSLTQYLNLIEKGGGTLLQTGNQLNVSNMTYRQFVYDLPFGEDFVKVSQSIAVMIDDQEVMRIGNFKYKLK